MYYVSELPILTFCRLKNFGPLWFLTLIYNVLKILFGGVEIIYILSQSLLDVLHIISFPVKKVLSFQFFFSIIAFRLEIFLFNLSSPLKFKEVSIFFQ